MPSCEKRSQANHEKLPSKDGLNPHGIFEKHLKRFELQTPEKLEEALFKKIESLKEHIDPTKMHAAIDLMRQAHKDEDGNDQTRKYSNQPYIVHTLRVALLTIDIAQAMNHPVTDTLIASALLHDTIEDSVDNEQSPALNERRILMHFFFDGEDFASKVSANVEAVSHKSAEKERLTTDVYFHQIRTHREPRPPELIDRLIIKTADRSDNLLDPAVSPEKADMNQSDLRTSRNKLITNKQAEFVTLLLDDQPELRAIVNKAAELSKNSLTMPDFSPTKFEKDLPRAS